MATENDSGQGVQPGEWRHDAVPPLWVQARRRWLTSLLVALVVAGAVTHHLAFVTQTMPQELAFDRRFWIDGESYERGGLVFLREGVRGVLANDVCHSPAQQLVVGAVFQMAGVGMVPVRVVSVIVYALGCLLLLALAYRLTNDYLVASATAILAATSGAFAYYAATLQYEPLTAALVVATLACVVLPTRRVWPYLLAGVLTTVLCTFRAHFVVMFVVGLPALVWRSRSALSPWPADTNRHAPAIAYAVGFLVSAALWIEAVSLAQGRLVLFHTACRLHLYNHANDLGFAWPYREVVPPAGLDFVLHAPLRYLWLVGERLKILWGLKPCPLHGIPVPFESLLPAGALAAYRLLAGLAQLGLFAFGLGHWLWRRRTTAERGMLAFVLGPVAAAHGLALFMGSCTRFLMPALPVVLVFQVHAVAVMGRAIIRRLVCPRART